jgi:hypothetical protein
MSGRTVETDDIDHARGTLDPPPAGGTRAPTNVRVPRDGIEAAIFESFREALDRPPSDAELTEWSARLLRGVPVRLLRDTLESSQEHMAYRAWRRDIATIEATRLFDARWYRARYPDVDEAGLSPPHHYVAHGWREDRWPNPWFDPTWYRDAHGLSATDHPLLHFATRGVASDLRPSRNFDPVWYREVYHLDSRQSPLADFLRRRHSRAVAPSADMWPALGLPEPRLTAVADDVFLSLGEANAAEVILRDTGLFDENYYALHSGDVLATGGDMLGHYCAYGWREERQPNFYFDSRWYTATNPEVARLKVNPLVHYLLVGELEGRRPVVYFDPIWYAKTYAVPDDMSALAHFLAHRREGTVAPNEYFDPAYYAAQKNETLRPGRDPFARFLVAGLTEDVPPSPRFDLAAWRRRALGRVSRHFRHLMDPARDNPLVHYLMSTYR